MERNPTPEPFRKLPLFNFIKYEDWRYENPLNGMDYVLIHFIKPEFVKDFGPWKSGHQPADLTFDLIHGTLTETNGLDPSNAGKTLNAVDLDLTVFTITTLEGKRVAKSRIWQKDIAP